VDGFSLHADVRVPARERPRLERLARYVLRPPLATERLTETGDGRLAYHFKRPWSDGSTQAVFTPHVFLERTAELNDGPVSSFLRLILKIGTGGLAREGPARLTGNQLWSQNTINVEENAEAGDISPPAWLADP